jgi:hypothetical protein
MHWTVCNYSVQRFLCPYLSDSSSFNSHGICSKPPQPQCERSGTDTASNLIFSAIKLEDTFYKSLYLIPLSLPSRRTQNIQQ